MSNIEYDYPNYKSFISLKGIRMKKNISMPVVPISQYQYDNLSDEEQKCFVAIK